MSERKNIDSFFKAQLEHAEVQPPETAWENIEARLNKTEKRRVVPFWWRFSGVAALLFFGLLLFGPTYYSPKKQGLKQGDAVVNQDSIISSGKNGISRDSKNTDETINTITKNNPKVVVIQENTTQKTSNKSNANKSINTNPTKSNRTNNYISDKRHETKVAINSNIDNKQRLNVSNTSPIRENQQLSKNKIVSNTSKQNRYRKKIEDVNSLNDKQVVQSAINISQNTIQKNSTEQNKIEVESVIANTKNKKTVVLSTAEKSEEIKKKDSINVAVVEPNALEELLKEKEKEEKIAKEQKENRWQVTPNIAPIYFSSISNGSPLDEKLAANEKVYGTNYSYGLNVNYALNKRVQLRSGIHSFSTDYDTKNIVFYQNTKASKMQNVTPTLQGSFIQIDPLTNVTPSFGRLAGDRFEGTLNQRMSYIEMPLEVSYKLLAKKFGVDLIGGISTLFLSENDVYLTTPGFTMKIGEASNLNNIHFSTNIGLGLKYSFLKRFDARVEPLFKYQINTYSSGDGNFKPYIFGIYSGISYHF